MKTTDQVGITFVNTVIAHGVLNGVVNITLGVFEFNPLENGKVDGNASIASRLRMDVQCAKRLHDELGSLLTSIEKTAGTEVAAPRSNGVDAEAAPKLSS